MQKLNSKLVLKIPNPNKKRFRKIFLITQKKLWQPLLDVESHTRSGSHFEPRHRKNILAHNLYCLLWPLK